MKVLNITEVDWQECVQDSQKESVVITKNGKPFVFMVGVSGMDMEQVECGQSDKLWKLMEKRRKQKPISRADLEKRMMVHKKV
jgi:hypothetical protein